MSQRKLLAFFLAALAPSLLAPARAEAQGFQVNRYEPTPAAEWFFSVERPWYSSTRYFAAGITLNYAHNPLVIGKLLDSGTFQKDNSVIENQFIGHLDLAGSFLDRVQVSATLPITLVESGNALGGAAPLGSGGLPSAAVGDPRVGVMVRLWNQADKNAFSIHLGANLWIPIGADKNHQGDGNVRFSPKLILAGLVVDHLRWNFTAAYMYRGSSNIGTVTNQDGSTVGQELQFGAALGYTDRQRKLNIGPELSIYTTLNNGKAFDGRYTGVELLLGAMYNFQVKGPHHIMAGLALGTGLLRAPGTPDFRLLARIAYAPVRDVDSDKDGIVDPLDACPLEKGPKTDDPKTNGCPDRDGDLVIDKLDQCPDVPKGDEPDPARLGCPLPDRDHDGIVDARDICPDVNKGQHPDPAPTRLGCPADTDKDGVIDDEDLCPTEAMGEYPDPDRKGCPMPDRDKDGVPDKMDECPDVAAGKFPDSAHPGCPLDTDKDGVPDEADQCVTVPMGVYPDPARLGCPLPDRDGDSIPDVTDACPDKPGAPDPDPKKNGCPGLVQIVGDQIKIISPVFFATDKDVILPKSFPVLNAVANALKATPTIKRVSVEGHTDSKGNLAHNMDLSERRAKSVLKWLAARGAIAADRLEAHGYGPARPIASNKTNKGRADNRRVEFHILDPKPAEAGIKVEAIHSTDPKASAPAAAPAKGKFKGKKGKGKRKAR